MKKLLLAGACLLLAGCAALSSVMTLYKCDYSFSGVENFTYAGVSLDRLANPQNITLSDSIAILTALKDGKATLDFDALIDVKNSGLGSASVDSLDWKLLLDGAQILEGVSKDKFTVSPNAMSQARIRASLDPKTLGSTTTLESLVNIYKKLSSSSSASGSKSELTIQLKPTISGYKAQDFITLKRAF